MFVSIDAVLASDLEMSAYIIAEAEHKLESSSGRILGRFRGE